MRLILLLFFVSFAIVGCSRAKQEGTISEILREIDEGHIKEGTDWKSTVPLGKPQMDLYWLDSEGIAYGAFVFVEEKKFLTLYWCRDSIYAAHFVDSKPPTVDKWLFCDMDKLREYIKLSIEKASIN